MINPLTPLSSQPCVLIVEDHDSLRLLLRQMLETQNYRVEEAADGVQALEVFEQSQPDIVLLDVMLPGLDGFEVCRQLRQLSGSSNLPILMITAREDNEAIEAAFAAGATDYLIKPVRYAVLSHRLGQLMRTRQAEEALRQSERLYRAVVEDQTELICRCRPDGTLTFVNEAYCRYFGKKREELIGQNCISLFLQKDREKVAPNLVTLTLKNPVAIIEHELIIPNGEIRWQNWTHRAIFDEQGQIAEIQSVGHDITARKKAETALQQVLAKLERRVEERTAELKLANLHLQHEITERKQAESQIRASLKEKEVLLKEIHHRVKNNLQIISSLLNLQSHYIEDPESRQLFRESQNRVRSMALIHEKLYRTDNLAQIDLGEYIRDLTYYLFRAYDAKSKELSFCLEASPIRIGIDTAVPCGLIINELITNALKHAFPNGSGGEIRISLQTIPEDQLVITIRDNGVGFPLTTELSQSKSLGLQLVNTLVSQLEGVITMQHQDGTEFRLTLPIPPWP
jgi:PAS domain S-box-containing protein